MEKPLLCLFFPLFSFFCFFFWLIPLLSFLRLFPQFLLLSPCPTDHLFRPVLTFFFLGRDSDNPGPAFFYQFSTYFLIVFEFFPFRPAIRSQQDIKNINKIPKQRGTKS